MTDTLKIIMPLADGGITDVLYDAYSIPGCPTCDYGSQYTDWFEIRCTSLKIKVYLNTMYEHVISEGWLMRTLLGIPHEMTEDEFAHALYEKICAECKEIYAFHYKHASSSWYQITGGDKEEFFTFEEAIIE